jgi:hypothetical protein
MRIATIEQYLANSFLGTPTDLERAAAMEDTVAPSGVNERFPFHIIVEASFAELDVAHRWCWQSFGPKDGECDWSTDYPACPIILAAEKAVRIDHNGFEQTYFVNPIKHEHTGSWTSYWFGKTNYNHGFGAFCFADKTKKIRFAKHVPHVDYGEKYHWAEDDK